MKICAMWLLRRVDVHCSHLDVEPWHTIQGIQNATEVQGFANLLKNRAKISVPGQEEVAVRMERFARGYAKVCLGSLPATEKPTRAANKRDARKATTKQANIEMKS